MYTDVNIVGGLTCYATVLATWFSFAYTISKSYAEKIMIIFPARTFISFNNSCSVLCKFTAFHSNPISQFVSSDTWFALLPSLDHIVGNMNVILRSLNCLASLSLLLLPCYS